MRNYNDDFNSEFGDDFFGRWEQFNNRMKSDRGFRREINKFQKDFEELMRLLAENRLNNSDNPPLFTSKIMSEEEINNFYNIKNISENEFDIENGKDGEGEWETRNWTSPDGSVSYSSFSRSSSMEDFINSRYKNKSNPDKTQNLAILQRVLDYHVSEENYEKAAELKKEIDELKKDLK